MAKLAFLALIFTALVAFNSVSAFRTIFTTTTIEDVDVLDFTKNSRQKQSCRREIRSEQVNDCKRYLTQSSPYVDMLKMTVENPRQQQDKEQLEQCCQELREVEEECQCKAVQVAFQRARHEQQGGSRHGGSQQEYQQRQILKKAQNLPSECKLDVQQCPIRSSWF